jgi:uncharacterized membrane protein
MLTLKHRLISTFTLLVLDVLWITIIMGPRYNIMIKNIQNKKMETNILYAFFAYTLMVIGLNKFVLPMIDIENITFYECFSFGAVFGIVLYGVYDFTAATVLDKWDMNLAIFDVLWGGFVYLMSCYILKFIN